jgi:uncharacterized protein (DUF2062 family)
MGRVRDWLQRRIRDPLVAELRLGATPESLAQATATGAAIGVLPFLGLTSLVALAVGRAQKLNPIALQVANYLVTPAQIALIIPFVRLGEYLTGASTMPLNPMEIISAFMDNPWAFLKEFGVAGLHGLLGWTLTVPALAWLGNRALRPLFQRLTSYDRRPF